MGKFANVLVGALAVLAFSSCAEEKKGYVIDGQVQMIPIEFNVNRPFAYIIRDKQTGTILFVGKVEKL